MNKKLRNISKFLSYILRHNPASINLKVDDHGWAFIDELIGKARNHDRDLDHTTILKVVHESEKNRFQISEDRGKIRANYGHSIPVTLDYQTEVPPDILYHGTAATHIDSIQQQGIHSGGRQYVHLSDNIPAAREVGQRHGKPVILAIQARVMSEKGYEFYPTPSSIWLTRFVPPEFIDHSY